MDVPMLGARDLSAANPSELSAETGALVAQLLQRLQDQEQQLVEDGRVLAQRDQALAERDAPLQRKDREIALGEAKFEKITFELARLKGWKFGAKSEAMRAEQRRLFEEALAEDEAGLREQLERLRREAAAAAAAAASDTTTKAPPRRRRRNLFPDRLRRMEHHYEPERTDCLEPGCGRPMTRIGQEASERLDIVPAEFFVHRQHLRQVGLPLLPMRVGDDQTFGFAVRSRDPSGQSLMRARRSRSAKRGIKPNPCDGTP
ncbi:IS66 family transposase zinc-finger binding domain-containing protein [Variovorax sp. H27-G14]|uniref:IS66 family transposase n=1 Tax=Variovorax sp. H27-G14 TaxID=3111914 RepID=UPI0038FCE0D7